MPEPAMSNALKDDIGVSASVMCGSRLRSGLATEDGGQQAAKLRVEESQRRLVPHRVLGEVGLLDLRIDGVAVERRGERRAVLEIGVRAGGRAARAGADVAGLCGRQRDARGLFARR